MRFVLMFIAIASLTILIVFAPQGLLTKPTYREGTIGPWLLVIETVPEGVKPDSVRAGLKRRLARMEVTPGLPVDVQPSLAAARGESDEQPLAGFQLAHLPHLHIAQALGMKTATIDTIAAIRAEFPNRGFLSLPLGNWKINERIRKRAREKDFQSDQLFLLHDKRAEKLIYLVPREAVEL